MSRVICRFVVMIAALSWASAAATAQDQPAAKKQAKQSPPFRWVNPLTRDDLPGVRHANRHYAERSAPPGQGLGV